ncbi:MAG: sporulation transcriptional regulator SpoIIID [Clostridia bacterium]|nr:sporulation transcriptional regulator SpoIIID [Clostridia bacterium]
MLYDIEARVIKEAEFVLKENATVRKTANVFGVSKSTVHTDLTKRLAAIDDELYVRVKRVLFVNLSERHIRGGIATRERFKALKKS